MIDKIQLEELINKLPNGVDKFILVGLFYGLNDLANREQLLNLTSSSVDFEKSIIILPSGRVVYMDKLLKKITMEAINQELYMKMGDTSRSDEDYHFNTASKYIIKTKPTKVNGNGLEPLTSGGLKARIRRISEFLVGDTRLTASYLKQSGVMCILKEQNKRLTIKEAEDLLKKNGLSIRRNNLIPMLKEINRVK